MAPPDPSRSEIALAGLLTLAGILGIDEGHLLHRKTRRVEYGILPKSGSLLRSFPSRGRGRRVDLLLDGYN